MHPFWVRALRGLRSKGDDSAVVHRRESRVMSGTILLCSALNQVRGHIRCNAVQRNRLDAYG